MRQQSQSGDTTCSNLSKAVVLWARAAVAPRSLDFRRCFVIFLLASALVVALASFTSTAFADIWLICAALKEKGEPRQVVANLTGI